MSIDRIAILTEQVSAQVNALTNLSDEQRERVREIAVASAVKNHAGPNLEGIANLVRGQAVRSTPNTFEANGGKL
jgi:hypothetical protein